MLPFPYLVVTAIQSDRTEAVLEDQSEWGEGSNPARADYAIYLKMYKVDKSGNRQSLTTTADTSDAEVNDGWTFSLTEDGHYQGDLALIPDYNNATAYVQYDAVYSGGVVYRALGATTGNAPPNATYWEVISDPTSLVANDGTATESANITSSVFNDILTPNTEYEFGNQTLDIAIEFGDTSSREEDVETYEYLGVLLDAMWIARTREEWVRGEKYARRAEQFFE